MGWWGVGPESEGMGAAGESEKGAWPDEDSEESEKRDSKRDTTRPMIRGEGEENA